MFDKNKLNSLFNKLNIEATDKMLWQFEKYYELLVEKNKFMNLTSITEPDDVMIKHFVDSAALLSFHEIDGKVIDVGTGAGFPGIPLKILRPDVSFTLLDSLDKRVNFLREVCAELGLESIDAIHGRAEDFGRDPLYREQYDVCVSRAVSSLPVLSEYCIPFIKKSGCFISYKSEDCEEEVNSADTAIETLGGTISDNRIITLPGTDINRRFVVISKESPTPDKYPRRAGKPEKKPL